MLLDGLVLGGELSLHHAGNSTDTQGGTHEARYSGVQCRVGEREDIGGN